MKKNKISQMIDNIDEKYVGEAAYFAYENQNAVKNGSRKDQNRFRYFTAAACLVFAVIVAFTSLPIAAEAEEYRDALSFFEENGLSTEGLSRADVKAIYRDITTSSFTYGKTAEVIRNSVPGFEIVQSEPTPEELARFWQSVRSEPVRKSGFSYKYYSKYHSEENWGQVFDKAVIECYNEGEPVWSAEFTDFFITGCARIGDDTAVWGLAQTVSSGDGIYAYLASVDRDGNVSWVRRLDHGSGYEYIVSVLDGGGKWAVIGRGVGVIFCYYDGEGTEIYYKNPDIGDYVPQSAARLGDGFIIRADNNRTGEYARVVKIDRDGNIEESYTYDSADCKYVIRDMIEYDGKVYLSAYAVTLSDSGIYDSYRGEIRDILDYVFRKDQNDVSDDVVLSMLKDQYTATLLVCDPDEGTPHTFYSVKSSLGGPLSLNAEGKLEWDVQSLVSAYFSPMTSSFTIGGTCRVYRYTFDENGALKSRTDTNETANFRR